MSKKNKINELDETQVEFNINEILKEPNEVFSPKNKSFYDDFITSLEKIFPNRIMLNFKNFISSSKSTGGLIIIFPEEKINEVRNNLIRVANNKDVKKVTIFPILKESEVANKILKKLGEKRLPFYIFCKYKNKETVTMVYDTEKKFLLKDLKDLQNKFIPDSSDSSISLDGENSLLSSKFFSEASIEQSSIYDLVSILNNSHNTLSDAISNISNLTISSISSQNSSMNTQNSSINTQKTSELSSFTINSNNNSNQITQDITTNTVINNFIKPHDISISKIRFTVPNNKEEITIKVFNKTDKVSSLFDYVESLIRCKKLILNCSTFDLVYGYPGKSLSQLKNKTLMEEGLFPLSEVYIIQNKNIK